MVRLGLVGVLLFCSTSALLAEDLAAIRQAIRLPSIELSNGISFQNDRLVYAGESPLVFQQIASLEEQLAANPKDLSLFRQLVGLQQKLRDPQDFQLSLKKLLQLELANATANPQNAEAQQNLATAYWLANKWEEAESAARLTVELEPTSPTYWLGLYYYLKDRKPAEAEAAFAKSVALTKEEDLDQRIALAMSRCWAANERLQRLKPTPQLQQAGGIQRMNQLEKEQEQALEEFKTSVKQVDQVLSIASQRLKDSNGQCGQDTRDRCLALLFTRDMARNLESLIHRDQKPAIATVQADTLKLMREMIPESSDDPVRVFTMLFVEMLSQPRMQEQLGQPNPDREALAKPYLARLEAISQYKDVAVAGSAAYLQGLSGKLFGGDPDQSRQALLKATRLCPKFNDAWQLLILSYLGTKEWPQAFAACESWHQETGNELSLFCLAKLHAENNDWKGVRSVVERGLKKFPDSLNFQLSLVACDLMLAEPTDAIRSAKKELLRIGTILEKRPPGPQQRNLQLLTMIVLLFDKDREGALQYGQKLIAVESDPTIRKQLQDLLDPEMKPRRSPPMPQ